MLHIKTSHEDGGRGFSLIEMLVASAIFAIAAAVAFILYSSAQKSYKAGETFSDQQQATRVAFDRMVSDIRLAGFNTNPDGDSSRVDEQVEGAWSTAVTIRGDFDYEDASANTTPESDLKGTSYNVVPTGNDEIVTYALSKPGLTSTGSITIRVDADHPRAKVLRNITIPKLDLTQTDPPYTLYRITLKDPGVNTAFPAPGTAGDFVYEPVADNIRSLTFVYYNDGGTVLTINSGDDASSVARSKIRRINVSVVGMTSNPDYNYSDSDTVAAARYYRKFDLQSDVNPENLGKTGVKDIDVTPPPAPTILDPVPGHCQGMLVQWTAPSLADGVTAYAIKYYPAGSPSSFSTVTVTYPHTEYGTIDYDGHGYVGGLTMGQSYQFQVQARDSAGNQSGWSAASTAKTVADGGSTTSPGTQPNTPQSLAATGNGSLSPQDSQVTLTWTQVKNNANDLSGDPDKIGGTVILRDALGYKLYRDTTSGFTPNDSTNLIANVSVLPSGLTSYIDTNVANCTDYYYKLVMVDKCLIASAASAQAAGRATTTTLPAKPAGLTGSRTSKSNVNLTWSPVTVNVNGNPTYIDQYKVYRVTAATGTSPSSIPLSSYVLRGTATGPWTGNPQYNDTLDSTDIQTLNRNNPQQSFFYVVSATDRCGNESAKSDPVEIKCSFNGTFTTNPADGTSNGGIVPISLSVSGTDSYVRARVHIPNLTNLLANVYDQEILTGPPWSFPAWDTTAAGAGNYTIYWEVENQKGCTKIVPTAFSVTANLACQITPTNPNLSPTRGRPTDQNKKLSWDIINNSGKDLDITRLDVSWTSTIGTHKLVSVEYPTGTQVTSFGSGAATPASADYSLFPLLLPATANGLCGSNSCIINMALEWDTTIILSSSSGELITIKYTFIDTSNATGSCTFSVKPDLTF